MEVIEEVGLKVAMDGGGNSCGKVAPFLNEPVCVCKNDSFMAALPHSEVKITYGIDFSQVPAIGCQWFSSTISDDHVYVKQIAPSRTFCIYEEVVKLRSAGLINGGSLENAIVCSVTKGWLNPPLRFQDEPCRHKVLDLIGDIALFAKAGSQGIPVAHIISYKGGHALHASFVRYLKENQKSSK